MLDMSFMMLILVGRASSAHPDRGASASASPDNRICRRSGAFSILIRSSLKAPGASTGRIASEGLWSKRGRVTTRSISNHTGIDSGRADHQSPPSRTVCLTEETVETLYLLGEQDRLVGVSGSVVRPPQARREKPRVSAFTSANIDKILALKPDLVLTFSDLQADIVADLIRRGLNVHAFNQRTVAGILDMIRMLGTMVGARERAEQLVSDLEAGLDAARKRA